MSNIKVYKIPEYNNFTKIELDCVLDPELSWKAKGLHLYLVSRPPGWKLWYNELNNRSIDGKDSVASALNELIDKKYLYKISNRIEGKFSNHLFLVFEQPTSLSKEEINKEIKGLKSISEINTHRIGFIYFIKGGNLVKIGQTSTSILKRLSTLQSSSPVKLRLLCYIKTTDLDNSEIEFHTIFRNKRVRGEWFNISKQEILKILHKRNEEILY